MKVDPLSIVYRVPQAVLDGSQAFLRERGQDDCEGTALWIGRPGERVGEVDILRVFVPEQECLKTPDGVAVRLTEKAHYTLTDNLADGELFYCRIHSHPKKAYHSDLDDMNAVITHQGAISIRSSAIAAPTSPPTANVAMSQPRRRAMRRGRFGRL